jgi:GAF domain-containing protein/anti-sigma regulatory factor (Ser/Thr protein kinase)
LRARDEEPPASLRLVIPPDLGEVCRAREALGRFVAHSSLRESRVFDLQVVASEAIANAIEHAASEVEVRAWLLPDRLVVEVENHGIFRPGLYKDDGGRRRGLGLPLMVSLADQVRVDRHEEGKTLVSFSFLFDGARRPVALAAGRPVDGKLLAQCKELQIQNEEMSAAEEELHAQHEELLGLHAQLEDAYGFSRALNLLGRRLASTLDLDEMLHHLLSVGVEALGADSGLAEVVEGDRWIVKEVAGRATGLKGDVVSQADLGVERLTSVRHSPFVSRETAPGRKAVRTLVRLRVKTVLTIPLLVRGEVVGAVLFADTSRPEHFTDEQLVFANALSAAAGLAMENSRLYSDAQRFAQQLELEARLNDSLSELTILATSRLEQDHILRTMVAEAIDAGRADSVTLLRRERDRWTVQYVAGKALPAGVRESEGIDPADVDRVLTEKVPLARSHEIVGESGSGSVFTVLVPLTTGSEVGWLLELGYRHKPAFNGTHEDWARRLSFTMSLALQNAKLYQEQRTLLGHLQHALLSPPQQLPGVSVGQCYESATTEVDVGGDFYDVYVLEGARVAIVIGDVSGKGIEAATLASLTKNALRAYLSENGDVSSAVAKVNALFHRDSPRTSFATLFCGVLDSHDGTLHYVSAGHPPGFVRRRREGTVAPLEVSSPVIGIFPDAEYHEETTHLAVGDLLLLYTDGIMEARRDSELFGEARIMRFAELAHAVPTRDVAGRLVQEAVVYAGGAVRDDMAALSIRRRRNGRALKGDAHGTGKK